LQPSNGTLVGIELITQYDLIAARLEEYDR